MNEVRISDCTQGRYGLICPKCKNHEQPSKEEFGYFVDNCKTIIYEDEPNGKLITHGQCMCISKEHWLKRIR